MKGFTALHTAVIGCSADSVEAQAKFKAKYNLNFPLLSDPEFKVIEAVRRAAHEAFPGEIVPGNRAHDVLGRRGRQNPQRYGTRRRARATPTKCWRR